MLTLFFFHLALHWAVKGGSVRAVRYLLDKGARVAAQSSAGQTAVQMARNDEVRALLTAAATAAGLPVPAAPAAPPSPTTAADEGSCDEERGLRGVVPMAYPSLKDQPAPTPAQAVAPSWARSYTAMEGASASVSASAPMATALRPVPAPATAPAAAPAADLEFAAVRPAVQLPPWLQASPSPALSSSSPVSATSTVPSLRSLLVRCRVQQRSLYWSELAVPVPVARGALLAALLALLQVPMSAEEADTGAALVRVHDATLIRSDADAARLALAPLSTVELALVLAPAYLRRFDAHSERLGTAFLYAIDADERLHAHHTLT